MPSEQLTFVLPQALWLFLVLPLLLIARWPWGSRRRVVIVAHLPFWRDALHETGAVSSLGGVLHRLAVFYQLGFATLLILALAGPTYRSSVTHFPRFIAILDNSATMGAIEASGKSRLQLARQKLREKLHGQIYTLVLTAPAAHLARLEDLRDLEPAANAGNPGLAMALAREIAGAGDLLWVLTDNAGHGWEAALQSLPDPLVRRTVIESCGETGRNVALHIREVYHSPNEISRIRVELKNSGGENRPVRLRWALAGEHLGEKLVELAALGSAVETLFIEASEGGTVELSLQTQDDLPTDNRAACRLASFQRAAVFLIAPQPPAAMVAALAAYPQWVDPDRCVWSAQFSPDSSISRDLTIFVGGEVESPVPPGNYLFFGTRGSPLELSWGDEVGRTVCWKTESAHPLLRHLDLGLLEIRRHRTIAAQSPWHPLAWTHYGPLLMVRKSPWKGIYLPFSLEDSQWTTLESFPLFMRNVLQWAKPQPLASYEILHPMDPTAWDIRPQRLTSAASLPPAPLPPLHFRRYLTLIALALTVLYGLGFWGKSTSASA